MRKLYLVSTSPRRIFILKKFGYKFKTIEPQNKIEIHNSPEDTLENARRKLEGIKVTDGVLLAADTLVILENHVMGKPQNLEEAKEFLRRLSGRTHEVYTGYVLKSKEKTMERIVKTEVTFFNLRDEDIELMLKFDSPLDKAGAYGIQEFAGIFVKEIKGSYYNVVGLPIEYLYFDLKSLGILPSP